MRIKTTLKTNDIKHSCTFCNNYKKSVFHRVKGCFTDTRLKGTPHYYGQFALCLGKEVLTFSLYSISVVWTPAYTDTSLLWTVCFVSGERSPYIFSILNLLSMDTCLIQQLIIMDSLLCVWGEKSLHFLYIQLFT